MSAYRPALKQRIAERLFPELRTLPESERPRALRQAQETPFDVIELLGMAFGLVAVTALSSYSSDGLALGERFLKALSNFLIAVPLLALALGPFLVRRTRRGLRTELEKRQRRPSR